MIIILGITGNRHARQQRRWKYRVRTIRDIHVLLWNDALFAWRYVDGRRRHVSWAASKFAFCSQGEIDFHFSNFPIFIWCSMANLRIFLSFWTFILAGDLHRTLRCRAWLLCESVREQWKCGMICKTTILFQSHFYPYFPLLSNSNYHICYSSVKSATTDTTCRHQMTPNNQDRDMVGQQFVLLFIQVWWWYFVSKMYKSWFFMVFMGWMQVAAN